MTKRCCVSHCLSTTQISSVEFSITTSTFVVSEKESSMVNPTFFQSTWILNAITDKYELLEPVFLTIYLKRNRIQGRQKRSIRMRGQILIYLRFCECEQNLFPVIRSCWPKMDVHKDRTEKYIWSENSSRRLDSSGLKQVQVCLT